MPSPNKVEVKRQTRRLRRARGTQVEQRRLRAARKGPRAGHRQAGKQRLRVDRGLWGRIREPILRRRCGPPPPPSIP